MFRDTPEFKEVHPTKNNINNVIKLRKGSCKKIWMSYMFWKKCMSVWM